MAESMLLDDDYDDDDDDNDKRNHEEIMAILEGMEIDRDMLKNLTKEDVEEYYCPFYELRQLDGDYIEQFERGTREGSITVSETYREYIEKYQKPLRAFDPRTGVYGIKHTAAGFYSAGCEYMEQENWDKAIANFAKAIELQPRHVPARGYKAECYFAQQDFLRAEAEAWNAVDLNPVTIAERDEASRNSIESLHPDCRAMYERMLCQHLVVRGFSLLYDKSYDDALMDFDEIIKRDPNIANAYHGRVMVYMKFSEYWKFDEWDKIIADCDKLIEAQYEELYALQCRGIAHSHLKNYDNAIADFTGALSMKADLPGMYLQRSYCHYEKKEYRKAVADADEAIRLGRTNAFTYRGIAYIELGEYEKAIADFDELLRLDKDDKSAAWQREKARKLMNGEPVEEEDKQP